MAKTELSDSAVEMEIESAVFVPCMTAEFLRLLAAVNTLNAIVPMSEYEILPTGTPDEWVVSGTAKDSRVYATTVFIPDGEVKYTLTSFPVASAAEVDGFLAVVRLFSSYYLKTNSVTHVKIEWQ